MAALGIPPRPDRVKKARRGLLGFKYFFKYFLFTSTWVDDPIWLIFLKWVGAKPPPSILSLQWLFFLQTFGFERNHVCWKKITDPESQELDSQRRHWWFMEGPGICHRKKTGFFCPPKIKAETWWGAINVVGAICFFFFWSRTFFHMENFSQNVTLHPGGCPSLRRPSKIHKKNDCFDGISISA